MSEVEDSLRRLRTDWIDLYQIHQPDPHTPIEETLRALDDLVRQGKVRYIGCSNFPAWQVMEAHWTAKTCGLNGFVSCQDEYSLVFRKPEPELMPAMRKLGLGLLPFFPLASGLLTGMGATRVVSGSRMTMRRPPSARSRTSTRRPGAACRCAARVGVTCSVWFA